MDTQACMSCTLYTFRSAEAQSRPRACMWPGQDMTSRRAGHHSGCTTFIGTASSHSDRGRIPHSGPTSSIHQEAPQTLPCQQQHRPYSLCIAVSLLPLHTAFYPARPKKAVPVTQMNVRTYIPPFFKISTFDFPSLSPSPLMGEGTMGVSFVNRKSEILKDLIC